MTTDNEEDNRLKAAAGRMLARMALAAETFANDPQAGALDAFGAALDLVSDVAELAAADGADYTLIITPMVRLGEALAATTDGIADPLLAARAGGRKANSVATLVARAEAVGVMKVLTEQLGIPWAAAAKDVAACLQGSSLLKVTVAKEKSAAPEAQVREWRNQFERLARTLEAAPPRSWDRWERQAIHLRDQIVAFGRKQAESGREPEAIRKHLLAGLRRSRGPLVTGG